MVLHTQHILHTYIPGITYGCFTTGALLLVYYILVYSILVYYILLLCYCGITHHGIYYIRYPPYIAYLVVYYIQSIHTYMLHAICRVWCTVHV